MIRFKGVNKVYGGKIKAVDNLNLTVNTGEIFGFLGPNGAGKTTTIKMMTGILPPTGGEIKINNIDIIKNPVDAKKQFGFVPDNPDMFLKLKGIEYVNFMADMYEVPSHLRKQRIESMAKDFDLIDALGDKIMSYSHGMRQKIVIMGALIHEPKLWILDEPMTGLDPKSSYILKEMMKNHTKNGNTVFFSTHVLEVAEKLCDRIAIINKGKILLCDTTEKIKEHFSENVSLESLFLELTKDE